MTNQTTLKPCSYFLVRYAPSILRTEGLNIGVLLHCPEEKYLGCLFAEDYRWLRRIDSRADLHLLGGLQQYFEEQFESNENDQEGCLGLLCESLSNTIRLEGPRSCLLEHPAEGILEVYARQVGRSAAHIHAEDTRLRVKQQLTSALVCAQVWQHVEKRIPAGRWTQPGDPFTFDYGYKPNGSIHLIHALSLKRDTQLAKTLVYTLDCVRRHEPASLTAVVEGNPSGRHPAALATQSILLDAQIALQPISGIDTLTQRIRTELHV